MNFQCTICSGTVEVPDDFDAAQVVCPNCGREIAVPHLDHDLGGDEAPDAPVVPPEIYADPEPAAPRTPDQFRAQMEAQHTRGKLVMGLVLAAVLLSAAAVFLFIVPPSAILEYVSGVSEKKSFRKLYSSAGLAPVGYYRSELLPGLRGETEGGRGWQVGEEGKTYLVVDAAGAARYFPPTDEGYERIKREAERYKDRDPTRVAPPRDRCGFFDPTKFQLITEGAPPVRGTLISINYGEYKGFYSAFSYVAPEGSPGFTEKKKSNDLEHAMRLSVAFVVPATGIDPEALWIQLDGMKPLKVPPTDSRLVKW